MRVENLILMHNSSTLTVVYLQYIPKLYNIAIMSVQNLYVGGTINNVKNQLYCKPNV